MPGLPLDPIDLAFGQFEGPPTKFSPLRLSEIESSTTMVETDLSDGASTDPVSSLDPTATVTKITKTSTNEVVARFDSGVAEVEPTVSEPTTSEAQSPGPEAMEETEAEDPTLTEPE